MRENTRRQPPVSADPACRLQAGDDGTAPPPPVAAAVAAALRAVADPEKAKVLTRFFKTGRGEYGEGDVFIGVVVPKARAIARRFYRDATLADLAALLASPVHEDRLTALIILVLQFQRAAEPARDTLVRFYLDQRSRINNWDLVDLSVRDILGEYLVTRERTPLLPLARSAELWDRRLAIIATWAFIRRGELADTFRIAEILLQDRHDLIHKAVGWMLREAGKTDGAALRAFLAPRCRSMPRTMLRYAIERFPEPERQRYLRGTAPPCGVR